MVVRAGVCASWMRDGSVEIDERRDDPPADERGERSLARNRRAGARHEEADGAATGVRLRGERRHHDHGDRLLGGCRSRGGDGGARDQRQENNAKARSTEPGRDPVDGHARIVLAALCHAGARRLMPRRVEAHLVIVAR